MKARLKRLRDAWAWFASTLHASWHEPPPRLHAAATALELPLRPSSRLRVALWLLRLLILVYVAQLALERHWLAASLVALLAVAFRGGRVCRWRCLRLETDRLFLISSGGGMQPVCLGAGAMRLGSHLLLVLRSSDGGHCVLLGPDNLAAGQLAALMRRLPDGTAAALTALHSVAASGSKSASP